MTIIKFSLDFTHCLCGFFPFFLPNNSTFIFMEQKMICQSCTMPIDNPEDRGTEKDGSKSIEYCKYCYQNGAFTNPGLSLEEMKAFMASKTKEMNLPQDIAEQSMAALPHLKRWQAR